jgi:hypothetical protein
MLQPPSPQHDWPGLPQFVQVPASPTSQTLLGTQAGPLASSKHTPPSSHARPELLASPKQHR